MKREYYDLTSSQNSIWLTEEFMSNTNINNVAGYLYINEKVNFKALEKALNLYAEKNDATRLRFCIVDGKPKQYLGTYEYTKFNVISVNSIEEMKEWTQKMASSPFNIIDSKLFEFNIFKFPNGHGGFNANFHHLISDAWTMSLFISEVIDYYSSIIHHKDISLEAFPSYVDYISSEQEYRFSKRFQKDKAFWNELFDSEPIISHISSKTEDNLDTSSKRVSFNLDSNLYNRINSLCKTYNLSIYTFFMAVYSIYIAKLNNNHSPIVGTPVLNRSNFKEKHTSGMFISTVPFKTTFTGDESFTDYLKDVGLTQLSIFRHQKYPYDVLLQDIKDKYNLSENLYDLALSYQNARDDSKESDIKYSSNWLFAGHISNSLDVHFYDMDNTGVLDIYYDYQLAKFTEEDIFNMHARIMEMVDTILDNPQISIKDISIITKEETNKSLNNYTPFEYDKNLPLVKIFEAQANLHPSKTAVIFEDKKMTYDELNNKANILALELITLGVKRNDVIGIMLGRGLDLLVSVWGILKSGATYMLIDPALPEDRIKYMLSNSSSPYLITNSNMQIEFENKILIDELDFDKTIKNPVVETNNDDGFCVIYTSGSTGTPKGVLLRRLSVINMVNSYKHFLYTDTCENFLSTSTVAFDMFIVENFVSLLSGKTVVLANEEEQKVPAFMSKLIEKYNIDFILSTPSKIELLLLNDETRACLKDVKIIQLGGEVLKESLYTRLKKCTAAKIFDGYGPSECTACASNKEVTSPKDITIGVPFLNTRIYILNDDLNMLPEGYTGEMYISGDGVGKGYINREDLTAKSFIQDVFTNNTMYKTGDIAKINKNGELVYLGRKDFQVKLRGLRIELDEITNKIVKIEGIINAVSVIKKVNNIDCICSYVVLQNSNDEELTEESVKNTLKQSLPYYMVPSHIIFMETLPITLNGKIDVKKLPDVKIKESEYIAPSTKTEKELEKLWCDILDMEKISTNANFFDLGGDSLCSIKLVSEIYSKLQVKINIKNLFDNPTISSLAKYIDGLSQIKTDNDIVKVERKESYPLSSAQKRIYFTVNMDPNSVTYNTPGALLFDKTPDAQKLEMCFNTILNSHCAFRTSFVLDGDNVVQKIDDSITFKLKVINEQTKDLNSIFNKFVKPFDLSNAPLFRAELYNFEDGTSALFIDMHHIICDGESVGIFVQELCDLYNGKTIKPADLDYIDYVVWEQNSLKSEKYDISKRYWLNKFEGEIPILNMPTTYARPSMQSFEGNKICMKISNDKIAEFCKKYSSTPFTLLLSVYYILLYKYTHQKDIIVGSPVIGRDNANLYNIIGMFVNTLALRTNIDSSLTFEEFLKSVTTNCFTAFEHQTYPFDELLRNLDISRDTSRNPLFDTMFTYQNEGNPKISLGDINTTYYTPDDHSSKFDFSLEIIPENDSLNLTLEYCTKLFSEEFMQNLLLHYINILEIVLQSPNVKICNINILTEKENNMIDSQFGHNVLEYPKDSSIVELFEKIAKENGNQTAIIFEDSQMTYSELDEKSSKFAGFLISLGIQKGDIISTILHRSSNLVVAMLGIMKCGAIYLPISTLLPSDRIEYILNNSGSKLCITDNSTKDLMANNTTNIDEIDFENISAVPAVKTKPDDVIYIIYTSGSTGLPKGVQVMNKNLNNFIHSFNKLFDYSVGLNDICLSSTSISFDVSIWEFFFTLLNGSTLCLYPHESIEDIIDYCKVLTQNNITMAYLPPNILQEVYSLLSKNKVALNKILIGVEPIKVELIKKFFELNENMKIVNGYGPTETTICCTAYQLKQDSVIHANIVPIGRPLHNLKGYILDKDMQPVPVGVSGELYIAGDNVTKRILK